MSGPYDRSPMEQLIADVEARRVVPLPTGQAGHPSGFMDRLLADYHRTGSVPVHLKDVSTSDFRPGVEDTKMWGDTFQSSYDGTPLAAPLIPPINLNIKVMRARPTNFELFANLVLNGTVWATETGAQQLVVLYQIGVGQSKTQVVRFLPFTPSTLPSVTFASGQTLRVVSDTIQVPMQSMIVSAVLTGVAVVPANVGIPHVYALTILSAPVVQ